MRYKVVTVSAVILLVATSALAGIDQEQARLLGKRKLPQRWDNVESIPSWLTGKKPWLNIASGSSRVTLKPGESSSVKIPAGETLMLYRSEEKWGQGDVAVYISNGSGLLVERKGRISEDGHSLYINHPFYRPYIVTVKRPERFGSKLKTALFISRTERLENIIGYRDIVSLDAPKVSIKKSNESSAVTYWKVSGDKPVKLKISGPVRVKLETRLIKPAMESALDQAYILDTLMDSTPLKTSYHYTGTEYRFALFVKGKPEIMGWRQTDYFDVPEGNHTLTITGSSDVYARIASLRRSDYLIPPLNDPADDDDDDNDDNRRAEGYKTVWDTPAPAGPDKAAPRGRAESDRYDFSARLSIDNNVRGGSMASVAVLNEMVRARPDYSPAGVSARRTIGQRSFYRDLVPASNTVGPAEYLLFNAPRLLYKNEKRENAYTPRRAIRNLLKRAGGALFVHVPKGEQNRLTYPLPELRAPSRLRVIVPIDGAGTDDIFIRFDDAEPMRIEAAPAMRVAPEQLAITQGEAALSVMSAIHNKLAVNTFSGPANAYGLSAPMITVGFAEIELPAGAKAVHVWSEGAGGPVTLALQYRASKPYVLDESFYRVMLARLADTPETRFSSAMKLLLNEEQKPAQPENAGDYARLEISNYYAPLQRRLAAARRIFMLSVARPNEEMARGVVSGDAEESSARARRAGMENQWLVALENWSLSARTSKGAQRRTAKLEMANALYNIGERFMADNLLRGYYLFSKDETLRYQAFKALEDRYRTEKDVGKLINLYAVDLQLEVDPNSAASLVSAFAQSREYRFAVMIGAAMPEGFAPKNDLARAAFVEGWRNLFKKTVDSMDDGPLKSRWIGYELAMKGEYKKAVNAWSRAGHDGVMLMNLLEDGLSIERGLTSKNREERVKAARRMAILTRSHPGPYVWKTARNIVTGYAGADIIYNVNRDAFFRMFTAKPGKPIKLKILGPVRVKIEARPLHDQNDKRPINDWIVVKSEKSLYATPVNNNQPSGGLEIVGSKGKPGAKVETIYNVGPGVHEITVLCERGPAFFRFFTSEPELPIPTVPSWNLQTVSQVISGDYGRAIAKGRRIGKTDIFETPDGGAQPVKTRITPRMEKDAAKFFPPESNGDRTSRLLGEHDFKSAIAEPAGNGREEIQHRMALLAYVAEHDQALRATATAEAQGLYASHPGVPGALAMLRRLTRDMAWVKAGAVTSGAGLRRVRLKGWAPQSASMRVRKALMRRLENDEAIVTGYNALRLALQNPKPTTFQLTFRLADIAYMPTAPVTILYRAGAGSAKRLSLSADDPLQSVLLSTPGGRGAISVKIENPLVNQFVRVKIYELANDGHGSSIRKPVVMDSVRTYYIATPAHPVSAVVIGPASVRVNELRDGQAWTRIMRFGAGIHNVKLEPANGAGTALFRVAVQEPAPGKRHSASRQIVTEVKPVPWPNFTFDGKLQPAKVEKAPSHAGQEDGTWNAMALYERRRSVQEDVDKLFMPEKFSEFRIGHDFANLSRAFHTHTHIFWRDREKGEGTAGLTQKFHYRPIGSQLGWSLQGIGYTQKPRSVSPREYSAYIKSAMLFRWAGPKWANTPSLAVYYRYLTANSVAITDVGYVDQDIFTSYKSKHKYGVIASDTLKYRPWMDTMLGLGIVATSNEDFAIYQPDHVSLRVFGKQLLWPFQLDVGYRVTRYFSDTDRTLEVDRRWLSAKLAISQWISRNTLLKAGVMELRDMDRNDDTWYVFASFGFGHARGYRDAFPGSVSFTDVKKFKIPQP